MCWWWWAVVWCNWGHRGQPWKSPFTTGQFIDAPAPEWPRTWVNVSPRPPPLLPGYFARGLPLSPPVTSLLLRPRNAPVSIQKLPQSPSPPLGEGMGKGAPPFNVSFRPLYSWINISSSLCIAEAGKWIFISWLKYRVISKELLWVIFFFNESRKKRITFVFKTLFFTKSFQASPCKHQLKYLFFIMLLQKWMDISRNLRLYLSINIRMT